MELPKTYKWDIPKLKKLGQKVEEAEEAADGDIKEQQKHLTKSDLIKLAESEIREWQKFLEDLK